ncbi:MAG: hypothetical protein V1847_01695, partial [Candidatus Diapherotrites archaeon]
LSKTIPPKLSAHSKTVPSKTFVPKKPVPSKVLQTLQAPAPEAERAKPAGVLGKAEAESSTDEQIAETKELMNSLETMYLKRQISEDAYKEKMLDYEQRLKELQFRKKNAPQASENMVERLIEKRAQEANVDQQKLKKVESQVTDLMDKYKIPENEVLEEIKKIDKGHLLEGMDKVVGLIEMEQKTHQMMQELLSQKRKASEGGMTKGVSEAGIPKKPAKEIKALALEVHKQRIITDFDRILEFVNKTKSIKLSALASELNMDKKQVLEYSTILSEKKLLEMKYPPFGEATLKSKREETGEE